MIYAYIRVSTNKQDCDNQKIGILAKANAMGLQIDEYIEDDGISGATEPECRALGGLLSKLRQGDIIICSELSRLGRQIFMIMRILEHCMKIGARLYTVKDGYELGDSIQAKVLAFAFGLSAEIERSLISMRTKEALARRKMSGAPIGRIAGHKNKHHKLDAHTEYIQAQLIRGTPRYKIAQRLNVAPKTLRHFIRQNHMAT